MTTIKAACIAFLLLLASTAEAQINGLVLDTDTQMPLSGAHVLSDSAATITNVNGEFVLTGKVNSIIVSHIGYINDTIFLDQLSSPITIGLKQNRLQLDQITIKGNLQEYSLKRMPSSIGYIPNLNEQAFGEIAYIEKLNEVPGIYVHSGSLNTNRITVRGIGSRTPYGSNRIKAYYGNIPLTTGDGTTEIEDLSIADIESIELLKGSKSALYGSGLGGVILINNKELGTNGLYGSMGATAASYNTLAVNGGVQYKDEKFSLSSNLSNANTDGWRQNSAYQRTNFSLKTGYYGTKTSIDFILLTIKTKANIPSSLNKRTFDNAPDSAAQNWLSVQGFEDYSKVISGLTIKHQFSKKIVNTSSVFAQFYDGYESRPFNILDDDATKLGIRNITSTQINRLKLQAGLELLLERYTWSIYETIGGTKGELQNEFAETRRPLSIFLNAQYVFANSTIIETGISLNTLAYKLDDKNINTTDLSGEYEYQPILSPFLGVNIPLGDKMNLYSSLSHGFSAPSVEETLLPDGLINPNLKPETGINSELGLRYTSLNKRIYTDICVYSIWIDNLLLTKRESEAVFYGANAGKTWHRGIELSSSVKLSKPAKPLQTLLNLNYHFIQATFTDFVDDGDNYKGNTLPGIPQQNIDLSFKFDHTSGFYFSPQYQFIGKQYLNDANGEQYPSYSLINAKLGYQKNWFELSLGVKNIINTNYASMLLVNAPSFGGNMPRYYYPGMPRNFYISLKLKI